MFVLRAGEGVVAGDPALVFVVVVEHREIDHPQRLPSLAVDEALLMPDFDAQRTKRVVDHLRLVGTEEYEVARLRRRPLNNGFQRRFIEVLDDRRLQAAFVNLRNVVNFDVSQASGAVNRYESRVSINFTTGQRRTTRNAQGGDTTVGAIGDVGKDLERNVLDRIGDFNQFHRNAQIRLVRAEAPHGIGVRDAREGVRQIDVDRFLEHVTDQVFHDLRDLGFVQERSFDIDLGKFRLTVSAQVFVTKTLGQLIVTVEASHHQQLLEQLRRLRQGKELA